MQGTIVDSACTIATGSTAQFIDMGAMSIAQMKRDGHGPRRLFSIYLVDCLLSPQASNQKFQIRFDGLRDDAYFRTHGPASGISLQIKDAAGKPITPGQTLTQRPASAERLRFDYYLIPVARHWPLRVGNYFSAIRFEMDYF